MANAVFLKLREGRSIRFGRTKDAAAAAKVKRSVEEWVREGVTISMANAQGELEDVNLNNVVAIEISEEPTPPTGSRLVLDSPRD